MAPNSSIKNRFATSLAANAVRGGVNFLVALLVARNLGPASYGDFVFLMGTFVALKTLMEMGTSNAFYTFISQRPRSLAFIGAYALWQLALLALVAGIIGFLLPQAWMEIIWLGHGRTLILLALGAVFFQEQAWLTVARIGEALRMTAQTQAINLCVALAHLALVLGAVLFESLTIDLIFKFFVAEYAVAVLIAIRVFRVLEMEGEPFDAKTVLSDYWTYCSPTLVYVWLCFAAEFADRWLLQHFGGSVEQGIFGVGLRISGVCLLVATSLLNIFWKESAEALETDDLARLQKLYKTAVRLAACFAALASGFLIPWSAEILRLTVGSSYSQGSMVLAIMLLYPIHQSWGTINQIMLFASGETRAHLFLNGIFLAINLPLTWFVLAPQDAWLPGLQLGSLGMALKLIAYTVISTNVISWWIGRRFGWGLDCSFQFIAIGGALASGWLAYQAATSIAAFMHLNIVVTIGCAFIIHCALAGSGLWFYPGLIGQSRKEMRSYLARTLNFVGIRFSGTR